jgi:hypothetical protein
MADTISEEGIGRRLEVGMHMPRTDESQEDRTVSGGIDRDANCPLCKISGDEVIAEFPRWRLARTKTMKGHKERLMLYHKDHLKTLDEQSIGEAYLLLSRIGSKFFSYTDKWAIFEPVYATVPSHWHRVASDLDERAQDYQQILKTPRTIIDNTNGTVSREDPIRESLVPPSSLR